MKLHGEHRSVLLDEVIEVLKPQRGETILDATVGDGGHAAALCEAVGEGGTLLGLDQDDAALAKARERLAGAPCRVILEKANFRNLDRALSKHGIMALDKAVFDLGLRTEQLERSGRGFSMRRVGEPLLMTFDSAPTEEARTAYEIVNSWSEEDLARIIREYGEERFAKRIASEITATRKDKPIGYTEELVAVIERAIPPQFRVGRLHFATKTFQALRIATNDELDALSEGLLHAARFIATGGRIAVISFHSLEDRIVKQYFRMLSDTDAYERCIKKPIVPQKEEIALNPRSRSAKLRVVERTA